MKIDKKVKYKQSVSVKLNRLEAGWVANMILVAMQKDSWNESARKIAAEFCDEILQKPWPKMRIELPE